MDKILILGKGYIGQSIYQYFKNSHQITIKSRDELDYSDSLTLRQYLISNSIDVVINCSGFTGRPNVDEAESKKQLCWDLNVVIPLNIVDVCNKLGVWCIQINSGCIYSGYEKRFSEKDVPNFGLFDHSSFYSKTKHAFETLSSDKSVKILRLRMPICDDLNNPRNYLHKILKYENLINFLNSKTYIPDLCGFLKSLLTYEDWSGQDIYNVVNPNPLTTKEVIDILSTKIQTNPNWIDLSELNTVAPRSNCVLDSSKASKIYSFMSEKDFLQKIIE